MMGDKKWSLSVRKTVETFKKHWQIRAKQYVAEKQRIYDIVKEWALKKRHTLW